MKSPSAAIIQSGYYEGYAEGYTEGWSKAVEQFQTQLIQGPSPRIIVTTEENLERLKKEYGI